MSKIKMKALIYFLTILSTILLIMLYFGQNQFIISLGIFPWLFIELIWFLVLRFEENIDTKILNLMFSFLFFFTSFLPLLEFIFFKTNIFSINKNILTLLETDTAFFILYIMLEIFFILYLILSLIYYFNLNTLENKFERQIKTDLVEYKNFSIKSVNPKDRLVLNLPKINLTPYNFEQKEEFELKKEKEEAKEKEKKEVKNEKEEKGKDWEGEIIQKVSDILTKRNEENSNTSILSRENIIEAQFIVNKKIEEIKEDGELNNVSNEIIKNQLKIEDILPQSLHPQFNNVEDATKLVEEKAEIILKTLKDFGIESKLLGYIKGPVVTRYELEVDEKVNLGKIINLEKNITYNLSAEKIRILAPIPGKKAVGVEIPNDIKQIVYFTDLAKSEDFKNCQMNLPFILGKDVEGKVIITDITKSPHILIAGRTGSGKSVCINTLIASLVVANPPEKVRLILIDPKRVELSLYNDLPHLLTDEIIIFPEDASAALKWLVAEMENRYSILKEHGYRSIEDYNQSMEEKLPYLVLIIDEFYALMQTSQKIIEDSLIHLSAMARAVGIHLIFATQRPSAEVVTGVIKSNLPSRIAFQTFSKTDSRIILDTAGAESLLGNGDMLFSFAGLPPIRIQGAFISTNEVRELVKKIAENYKAEKKSINELFATFKKDEEKDEDEYNGDDPLYPQAIEIVKRERKVSASYLQRRLKIGYNRAARIVEQMEQEGLISSLIDGKKREIYI